MFGRSPKILTMQQMLTSNNPGVAYLRGKKTDGSLYYYGKEETSSGTRQGAPGSRGYAVKIGGGAAAEPEPAPKAKAKPKPKPKPKAKLKPTKDTSFSDAAKKLMADVTKKLDALKITQDKAPAIDLSPFEKKISDLESKFLSQKPKLYNTGSIGVNAAPLQINAAAPTPQTTGVDLFKRRKPSTTPSKTLTSNSLNI